jgi:hypothetical protein
MRKQHFENDLVPFLGEEEDTYFVSSLIKG